MPVDEGRSGPQRFLDRMRLLGQPEVTDRNGFQESVERLGLLIRRA